MGAPGERTLDLEDARTLPSLKGDSGESAVRHTNELPLVEKPVAGLERASPDTLLELAQRYQQAGFSIVVVDGNKRPVGGRWGDAKHGLPLAKLRADLEHHGGTGLAVVGGRVSGGLVVLDFDVDKDGRAKTVFDLEREFVRPWLAAIADYVDPATLPCQRTPSGGWQFYLRCSHVNGSTKLAGVPAWKKHHGDVLIGTEGPPHYAVETRGEGGLAVIPTPGSGREWCQGDLTDTPQLEQAVADAILAAARALDRVPQPAHPGPVRLTSCNKTPMGPDESVITA